MRLPGDDARLSMYGKTGSGKTVAGLWHLSERSYDEMPWVIVDTKQDPTIAAIPYLREIGITESAPTSPGLYVTRPIPERDDDAVDTFLWDVWGHGSTGLFVDEGYMIPRRSKAFQALLTQGRSRRIPTITLSQRPVWMSRFVISEADFHQIFFLSDQTDRDTIQRFIPTDMGDQRLPKFHSYYYDVGEDLLEGVRPVPEPSKTYETFETRLSKIFRVVRRPRLL